jgi:2-oxoglutarate dehydrogenase E2 component (dihydrolipoamide succinyltransferase)
MDLRSSSTRKLFEKSHNGVRLGFMSFFVKAATEALKRFPAVNASIDGTATWCTTTTADISVAVSSDTWPGGTPVLRDVEHHEHGGHREENQRAGS